MQNKEIEVVFIQGRPFAHPTHANYAKSVNSDFSYIDIICPYYNDLKDSSIKRYFSWIMNAIFFKNRQKYHVFLSEEPYFYLGFMKFFGLINDNQKLVSMFGTHTLYFLYTGKYSKVTSFLFKKLFNQYDLILCEGKMQEELLRIYIQNKKTKIIPIFNGNPSERYDKLYSKSPKLNSFNILTIGSISNQDRIYYKGLDLMLEAFAIANEQIPELTFTIIGTYDSVFIENLLSRIMGIRKENITFAGYSNDIEKYILTSDLYLHTARGEAWGISVTEALLGGLPAIVSEWTGSKEVVEKISKDLIVSLDKEKIANKIVWYFNLSDKDKQSLSNFSKAISSELTEQKANENFKKLFYNNI